MDIIHTDFECRKFIWKREIFKTSQKKNTYSPQQSQKGDGSFLLVGGQNWPLSFNLISIYKKSKEHPCRIHMTMLHIYKDKSLI